MVSATQDYNGLGKQRIEQRAIRFIPNPL